MAQDLDQAISGKDGDVIIQGTQVCEVTKWTYKETANNPTYASNCSRGGKKRRAGTTDSSGTIEGKWNPGRPVYGDGAGQLRAGREVRLFLYLDQYQYIDVRAVFDTWSLDVDIDSGDIIGWTSDWSQMSPPTMNFAEESSLSSSSDSSSSSTSSSSSS